MFSRHTAGGLLQHVTGRAAIFAEPSAYVALFTTAPTADDGTGGIEVSGGGYARVATSAASWQAATAPPPLIANSAGLAFPAEGSAWGTIVAAGLYDAASGGNLLAWDWLGAHAWRPCTISAASPAVIDLPAHNYALGDEVAFTTLWGGAAPALAGGSGALGSNALSVVASRTADTFTLTTGGTAVNTTGTGNGMARKVVPASVPQGITLLFPPGALVLIMGASIPAPLAAVLAARAQARPGLTVPAGAPVLGTGTATTDALGAGTGSSDLLGVQ